MVVGKIVNYDPSNDLYFFPKEKADLLTRKTKIYNFTASMQWIPILSQVEDEMVNCFKQGGGGVPYSSYHRFYEVMEEESAQTVLSVLFESVIPLVPELEERLKKRNKCSGSCLHCMSIFLAQDGIGLGAMWGKEKAVEILKEAGFTKVDVKQLPHDFQNYYYICRIK
jgi:hypothetical protein